MFQPLRGVLRILRSLSVCNSLYWVFPPMWWKGAPFFSAPEIYKSTVALVRKISFGYKCIVSLKTALPPQGVKTIFDFLYQHIQFWVLLFRRRSASRLRVKITQQTRVVSPKRDSCFRTFAAKITGARMRFLPRVCVWFFFLSSWEASSLHPDSDFLEVWRYKFWSSFSPVRPAV